MLLIFAGTRRRRSLAGEKKHIGGDGKYDRENGKYDGENVKYGDENEKYDGENEKYGNENEKYDGGDANTAVVTPNMTLTIRYLLFGQSLWALVANDRERGGILDESPKLPHYLIHDLSSLIKILSPKTN